ncbi:MAG: hypothetical protein PVH68_13855 [Armatimonadota bacterium]|jgi:formate C-acetyltransferase
MAALELRDARRHPERYAHLVARVWAYSDYFTKLGGELQEYLIQRTRQTVG